MPTPVIAATPVIATEAVACLIVAVPVIGLGRSRVRTSMAGFMMVVRAPKAAIMSRRVSFDLFGFGIGERALQAPHTANSRRGLSIQANRGVAKLI